MNLDELTEPEMKTLIRAAARMVSGIHGVRDRIAEFKVGWTVERLDEQLALWDNAVETISNMRLNGSVRVDKTTLDQYA